MQSHAFLVAVVSLLTAVSGCKKETAMTAGRETKVEIHVAEDFDKDIPSTIEISEAEFASELSASELEIPAEQSPIRIPVPVVSTKASGVPSDSSTQPLSGNATHEQVKLIKTVNGQDELLQLNTFCLTPDDEILAGCGNGPGEIRVYSSDGQFIRAWELPAKPEAISAMKDGHVLVAGEGQMLKYKQSGELVLKAEAPHAESLRGNADDLRKQIEQQQDAYARQITAYQQRIDELNEKKTLADESDENPEFTSTDERRLGLYERNLKRYAARQAAATEPTEEEIAIKVRAMISRKLAASSISSDDDSVFLATRAISGSGYAIWKTNHQFENPKQIVTGLRGCCGQMDVQACSNGICVAENSRHRVVCYDNAGQELAKWGERDRTGNANTGFGGCCNPMNVAFDSNGDVYTAESGTGRIKRFNREGELVSNIGAVELVPGCKKVSIAVSSDGDRVYMLDITRNHIILMGKKSPDSQLPLKTVKTSG